jgi:hypothetical protein
MRLWIKTLSLSLCAVPLTAFAADDQKADLERPTIFTELVGCRDIGEPEARLACYDAKVAALDEAQKREDIIVTDRETVKETKRGLFGFSLPKLKIFGSEGNEQLEELTSSIKSAGLGARGKWKIVLEDGAVWEQVDTKRLSRNPQPGMSVVIKKAAVGSFFVKVDGQTALRMRRVDR